MSRGCPRTTLVDHLLLLGVTALAGGLLLPLAHVVWVTALHLVLLVQLGLDHLEVLPVLLGEPLVQLLVVVEREALSLGALLALVLTPRAPFPDAPLPGRPTGRQPHLVLDNLVILLLLLGVPALAGVLLLPLALVAWVTTRGQIAFST